MALSYSSMLELGSKIPDFKLINALDGQLYSSSSLHNDKPSLIMVICNHCPYVIHYHEEVQRLTRDYVNKLNLVAISSNDVSSYPQDGPEAMKDLFNTLGLSFPYLFDETQEIAKTLKAECTPEFYLYDGNNALVYRGRLDASSPGKDVQITGLDLRAAIDNLLDGNTVSAEQHPSMGCGIKWK
ncbi:MAG: thioredoxin family protein [Crocinitomicaceae bacterium]|nr:thioredoxin family protein [Crocinitomicaceae bacterium]